MGIAIFSDSRTSSERPNSVRLGCSRCLDSHALNSSSTLNVLVLSVLLTVPPSKIPINNLAFSTPEVLELDGRGWRVNEPSFEQQLAFDQLHLVIVALALFIDELRNLLKAGRIASM
jgi:hypothetical protein